MRIAPVCDFPSFDLERSGIEVLPIGEHFIVRTDNFLASVCFDSGDLNWCIERDAPTFWTSGDPLATLPMPTLAIADAKLWACQEVGIGAEIFHDNEDCIRLVARDLSTGAELWDYKLHRPPLADWAEQTPAWPGAPQEEMHALLSRSEDKLVLCLNRHTRTYGMGTLEISVTGTPETKCQTDLYCLDATTGRVLRQDQHVDLHLDILSQQEFGGPWTNDCVAGWLDLASGSNKTLTVENVQFGRPALRGEYAYFPWFNRKDKRIGYICTDNEMQTVAEHSWEQRSVREIAVWPTSRGVALQVNSQKVVWTVDDKSLWVQTAKPYIYQAFATESSDVFVATDGNGGRLFGFDPLSGNETYNFRPALGGFANTHLFERENAIVTAVAMKKSHSVPPKLSIVDTESKELKHVADCWLILKRWKRGVVFVTGKNRDQLSILDLTSG